MSLVECCDFANDAANERAEAERSATDAAAATTTATTTDAAAKKKTVRKARTVRWALTGTVLQNGTDDCFAVLAFLRAAPLDDFKTFRARVSRRVSQTEDPAEADAGLALLRRVLAPLAFQRSNRLLKDRLPGRTTLVKRVALSPGSPAAAAYGALFHSTQVVIQALSAAGDKALLSNCESVS